MKTTPTPTTESTKTTADIFSSARSVYGRRKTLREKADKLLADAPARVRAIVESIEEEEASEPIDLSPAAAAE
jgi:hypothetical protein